MLVADGVDQIECDQLRRAFEEEGASVFVATNQEYVTIETVFQGRRGHDIIIDLPFEAVEPRHYDGLVIPDGFLAARTFEDDERVAALVRIFHTSGRPIFASGKSSIVLEQAELNARQILIREGASLSSFITQAIAILAETAATAHVYRATSAV